MKYLGHEFRSRRIRRSSLGPTAAYKKLMKSCQAFGGTSQHTEIRLSIPLFPIDGSDCGAGPGFTVPASTRTTRARISPARSHSPQGILARIASPAAYI